MTTVLLSGVGNLGGWALEFLARSEGIDRIITLKRGKWEGASRTSLAMIGSVFQGHTKDFSHHQLDLADLDAVAGLIAETAPSAILHSATVGSPRRLMGADLDPGLRATIEAATFGMWLPWHLLPATQLMRAAMKSGVETRVVNASFPDVVNVVLWKGLGAGPTAGAGNVEILAARLFRHVVANSGASPSQVDVSLVGSHALLTHGPDSGVPYHLRIRVAGSDVTDQYELGKVDGVDPIDWRRVPEFSIFAASAVKNLLALLGEADVRTHVTSPLGLPGGYPADIGPGGVQLRLPPELTENEAIRINERAARWDGIEEITDDGTVVYTSEVAGAMSELGYPVESISIDEVEDRSEQLMRLIADLSREES